MSRAPYAFWHKAPVVSLEFEPSGWNVVVLTEDRREFVQGFGTIEPAVTFAKDIADANHVRFVPGAARPWLAWSKGGARHA